MSIHQFTRVPVRKVEKQKKDDGHLLRVHPFAFLFMLLSMFVIGLYFGLVFMAGTVQAQCADAGNWQWESAILAEPINVECKPAKKG